MLNVQITNAFIAAQRQLQSVNGETITISSVQYPCLPADLITGDRLWEAGGASDLDHIAVSILKEDMPTGPMTNAPATFRGESLRVIAHDDADTFWTVRLIQPKA